MGAVPLLPPYAHLDTEAVQCIAQASVRYEAPELLLHAIINKENGRTGQCVRNRDGSYDCGLAQINTSWAGFFAKQGVNTRDLYLGSCLNIYASAYILKYNFLKKGNWPAAIVAYNIGPNATSPAKLQIGQTYAADVIRRWWGFHNWVVANPQYTVSQSVESPTPEGPEARTR